MTSLHSELPFVLAEPVFDSDVIFPGVPPPLVPTSVLPPVVLPVLDPVELALIVLKTFSLPPGTPEPKEVPVPIVVSKTFGDSDKDRSIVALSSVDTIDVKPFPCVLSSLFPTIETLAPVLSLFCKEVSGLFSSVVRMLNVVNSPGVDP